MSDQLAFTSSTTLSPSSFRPKWRNHEVLMNANKKQRKMNNLFADRTSTSNGEQIFSSESIPQRYSRELRSSRFRYRSTRKDVLPKKRTELQRIFRNEVGVREATGKNDGPRIKEYLAITNLGEGHAYCAAFISYCFSKAGFAEPRTPWSPALFPKDRVIWEKGKQNAEVRTGDVFGLWFPNLGRIAHAGFIDEWGEVFFKSVEGNTNEAGTNEGDGVYRKRRRVKSIHQIANWVDEPTR